MRLSFSCLALALMLLVPVHAFGDGAGPELVVVISDLHLGVGETSLGEWSPYEDFRWGSDFILFLDEIHRLSNGRAVLVLAGDTFELWQSETTPCNGISDDTGCTLEEAIARVQRVLTAHQLEMRSLGEFAMRGMNRVVFIPGNHDAAVLHPQVWSQVLKATGLKDPERVSVVSDGTYIAPNRRIIVEHGHQWDEVNSFAGWPKPWVEQNGKLYFHRPWGEQLVRRFYNDIERRYAVIDNFTGDLDGLAYGFAAEGLTGTSKELYRFLRMLVRDNSRTQFGSLLGSESKPPVWDVPKARMMGIEFLVQSMQSDSEAAQVLQSVVRDHQQVLKDAALDPELFSDTDVAELCQSRYVTWLQQRDGGTPEDRRIALCPHSAGDLSYAGSNIMIRLRGYDARMSRYLDARMNDWRDRVDRSARNILYIYGHTHGARSRFDPRSSFENLRAANTGAWQRLISPEAVKNRFKERKAVVKDMKLENLPPCYSAIWIRLVDFANAELEPLLVYWSYNKMDERWSFTRACPERE